MWNKSEIERALVAVGICGGGCILATDGETIAFEIEQLGTCWVEDILGHDWFPDSPGFYLWTGTGQLQAHMTTDGPTDPELEWDGNVRPVKPEELAELLAMRPPERAEKSEASHG